MRDIPASAVTAAVKALCVPANNQLPPDVEAAVRGAYESEPWPIAKQTLGTLCQNLDAARATGLPICQDTGMACVFAEIGQDVHITGGSFEEAVDEGVRQGYTCANPWWRTPSAGATRGTTRPLCSRCVLCPGTSCG